MSNRIRVVGYTQRQRFDDGIEYRNFSPDLVGLQLADNGGTTLFTMGNFSVTTNTDPKLSKIYTSSKFSNFVTLSDLNVTLDQANTLLSDNAAVNLNLDKRNLNYYALFGSLTEFIRVSLEDIILKWPASLYLSQTTQDSNGYIVTGNTFENYSYDSLTQESTFRVNTSFINNKFQIVYTTNGNIVNTFNQDNQLRNFTTNYDSYVVYINNTEYEILNYTASTYTTNDYAYFKVKGDPFSGVQTTASYHIKPNQTLVNDFFNKLPDFEAYLLNRQIMPQYTAVFKFSIKSDSGLIIYTTKSVTWPVSDGYNIDFDTTAYGDYVSSLLEISDSNDLFESNLMNRFLVSESISAFDTTPINIEGVDDDETGGKVNKLLQIYGAEYDKINNYIEGIKFANTVTYDKQDNTPDVYLKDLARVLGWELISSVFEQNLIANYVDNAPSTYSGLSVGLTATEADVELWRRIILNTPWIWKSKGARKTIEFLLKFIGAPDGIAQFNEYIYKVDGPIDVDLFLQILRLNNLDDDLSIYPIDSEGYPRPFANTASMYFQNYGLWYRETGGTGSTIDISTGNNPHVGPYDRGSRYINQFRNLIPNFTPVMLSSVTTSVNVDNLYINYDNGNFNVGVTTATTVDTVDITNYYGYDIGDCVVFTPSIVNDPNPTPVLDDCGCEISTPDLALSLCVDKNPNALPQPPCDSSLANTPYIDTDEGLYVFQYYQYNQDGSIYTSLTNNPILYTTNFTKPECCKYIGGTPYLYEQIIDGVTYNTGYVCCDDSGKCGCTVTSDWEISDETILLPLLTETFTGPQEEYLQFLKPNGQLTVVLPDGCRCPVRSTDAVPNVLDPYTNQVGVGCQKKKFIAIEI